ncbi:sulfatase-like hydrolase/transferase [Myxococcota bacterium]|nr:sulfatase-like hydrolase/transferase [Myxococcota bacterium]
MGIFVTVPLAILSGTFALACSDAPPLRTAGATNTKQARLEPVPASDRPNILLITVDTLRADRTSVYGYGRPTTPHLEAIAMRGARLDPVYTPMPTTLPAHVAMFTARHGREFHVRKNGTPLPEEAHTLAERLAAAGYDTAAFVSSYVLDHRFGTDQGFSVYDDDFRGAESDMPEGTTWDSKAIEQPFDRRGSDTVDAAIAWLEQRNPDAPFFLWVHLFDPHQPLRPREPFASEFVRPNLASERDRVSDQYDAEVAYADAQIGRIVSEADRRAPDGETLTVITSDHGEGLWDHGWLEHGVLLYEEASRVPLIFRWPGRIPAGLEINQPASLLDLTPTVLGLAGLPMEDEPRSGRDLTPQLTQAEPSDLNRRIVMARRSYRGTPRILHRRVAGSSRAVRWRQWKLIRSMKESGAELYNLDEDPQEIHNIASLHPAITDNLSIELKHWHDSLPLPKTIDSPLDPEVSERLKALGYVP